MPYCPDCGATVTPADRYCGDCGTALSGRKTESPGGDEIPVGTPADRPQSDSTSDLASDERGSPRSQKPMESDTDECRPEDGIIDYAFEFPRARGGMEFATGVLHATLSFFVLLFLDQFEGELSLLGEYTNPLGVQDLTLGSDPLVSAASLGLLTGIAIVVSLPLISVFGYVHRLTRRAAHGGSAQPSFTEYRRLLRDGVPYFVVAVICWLVASQVDASTLLVLPFKLPVGPEVLLSATVLLAVAVTYPLPAIFVRYAVTDRLSGALAPRQIVQFSMTVEYLRAYVLGLFLLGGLAIITVGCAYMAFMLVLWVGMMLAILMSVVPEIGWVDLFRDLIVGGGAGLVLAAIAAVLLVSVLYLTGAYWGGVYYRVAQNGSVPPAGEYETPESPTDHKR